VSQVERAEYHHQAHKQHAQTGGPALRRHAGTGCRSRARRGGCRQGQRTPGSGAMACRSIATILAGGPESALSLASPSRMLEPSPSPAARSVPSWRLKTWLHDPGAAHRSTTRRDPVQHGTSTGTLATEGQKASPRRWGMGTGWCSGAWCSGASDVASDVGAATCSGGGGRRRRRVGLHLDGRSEDTDP